MASIYNTLLAEPPNSVLSLSQECLSDTNPNNEINLTFGVYRTEEGKNFVLQSVKEAKEALNKEDLDHEYLPQDGLSLFNSCARNFLFGENSILGQNQQVYTIQTVAGTAAVRLGAEFLKRVFPAAHCAIPNITWQNHPAILDVVGFPS